MYRIIAVAAIFLSSLFQPSTLPAAQPLTKVIMTSGSFSEREAAMYVAQDQGIFRRYGLELTFVTVRNGPVGMAALAWMAGFVTPGAPAGLGVREAVLLALLERLLTPQQALLVVVLWRVVTTLGDVVFFGIGLWAGRRRPASVNSVPPGPGPL